jgi:two-component system, NarL family, nitrate/nitrite response regulator NarL
MISILITGSVRLYRDSLAFVLGQDKRFRVAACALTHDDVWRAVREERPDIVLLDIALAGSTSLLRDLKQYSPDIAVVALAVERNEAGILSCAEAGAAGYVTRDAPMDTLIDTILWAANGELHCPPRITGILFRRVGALALRPEGSVLRRQLTAREHEVLAYIERGWSNKLIARRLRIKVATVKNHVHNILGKLGARGRGEAAAIVRDRTSADA